MLKLFIRTLWKSVKYVGIFLGVYFIGNTLLTVTLANFFKDVPLIPTLIVLGIPAAVVFFVSLYVRINDKDRAKQYRNKVKSHVFHIGKDLANIVLSKEFMIDLLVFCTYFLLLSLVGGRIIFHSNIGETIVLLMIAFFLYGMLDMLSWLCTHIRYLKDEVG